MSICDKITTILNNDCSNYIKAFICPIYLIPTNKENYIKYHKYIYEYITKKNTENYIRYIVRKNLDFCCHFIVMENIIKWNNTVAYYHDNIYYYNYNYFIYQYANQNNAQKCRAVIKMLCKKHIHQKWPKKYN